MTQSLQYSRQWWRSNPVKRRKYALKSKYGLTPDQYSALLKAQHGRCAICRRPPEKTERTSAVLCVDHDHTSGRTRGLLCATCNLALGYLNDNPLLIKRALRYIQSCAAKQRRRTQH